MLDILLLSAIAYIVFYAAFSWLRSHGFCEPTLVFSDFQVIDENFNSTSNTALATALSLRIGELQRLHSPNYEPTIFQGFGTTLRSSVALTVPRAQAFSETWGAVTIESFKLGPFALPLNTILFSAVRYTVSMLSRPAPGVFSSLGIAVPHVIRGFLSKKGDLWKVQLMVDNELISLDAEFARLADDRLIDEVAHRLLATFSSPKLSHDWRALMGLSSGLEHFTNYIKTSDEVALDAAKKALTTSLQYAPAWDLLRLQLARVHFARAAVSMEAAQEAARLFDSANHVTDSSGIHLLADLGTLNSLMHWLSSASLKCDQVEIHAQRIGQLFTEMDGYVEELQRIPQADAHAATDRRIQRSDLLRLEEPTRIAYGYAAYTIAEILSFHECSPVAKVTLSKFLPSARRNPAALFDIAEEQMRRYHKTDLYGFVATNNLAITLSYKARFLLQQRRFRVGEKKNRVRQLLEEAILRRKELLQRADVLYLEAAIASDHLRLARLRRSDDSWYEELKSAKEILEIMATRKSGNERIYAWTRLIDVMFSLGEWWSANDIMLSRACSPGSSEEAEGYDILKPWLVGASKISVSRESVSLMETKLHCWLKIRYSIYPHFILAEMQMRGGRLGEARATLDEASRRLEDEEFAYGPMLEIRRDLVECKLLAIEGKLEESKRVLAKLKASRGRNEVERTYRESGDFLLDLWHIGHLHGDERLVERISAQLVTSPSRLVSNVVSGWKNERR